LNFLFLFFFINVPRSAAAQWMTINITQLWHARVWKCSKMSELRNKFATQRWSPYVHVKFSRGLFDFTQILYKV